MFNSQISLGNPFHSRAPSHLKVDSSIFVLVGVTFNVVESLSILQCRSDLLTRYPSNWCGREHFNPPSSTQAEQRCCAGLEGFFLNYGKQKLVTLRGIPKKIANFIECSKHVSDKWLITGVNDSEV